MRSHNLIPIRWGQGRSRQRDKERYREPGTAPNFVRKICPLGRWQWLWCIYKSSSFFSFWKNFSSEGVVFFRKNAYIINRIFICEGVIQRERKPWYIRRFVLPSGAFATGCTYLRIGAFLFAPNNKIVFVAVERTYPAHTPGYISLNTLQISSARTRRKFSKWTPRICRKVASNASSKIVAGRIQV